MNRGIKVNSSSITLTFLNRLVSFIMTPSMLPVRVHLLVEMSLFSSCRLWKFTCCCTVSVKKSARAINFRLFIRTSSRTIVRLKQANRA